ncbi:hypothetical protein AWC38_SpisGene24660, partial [Stylophora pistillata]
MSSSNMAEQVMPKLDLVQEKLGAVEFKLGKVESKLEELENHVKSLDAQVCSLQTKVECLESFQKKTERTVNDIENGMNFADEERKSFMMRIQELQTQLNQLKDEKLYMEVFQRRENLRFFGIQEVGAEEDTKEGLVNFLRTDLGLEDADGLESQRAHQIGKRDPSNGKPRKII